jgi:Domain of unknown function (DUF4389)
MSEAAAVPVAAAHPVGLVVTDDLKRSRLTVFFRLLLAVPHLVWFELWGIVACLVVLVAWFAALFTGRVPDGLHAFIARYLRYTFFMTALAMETRLAATSPSDGGLVSDLSKSETKQMYPSAMKVARPWKPFFPPEP